MKDELGKTLAKVMDLPEPSARRVLGRIPVGIACTVALSCDRLYWAILDKEGRN